MSYPSYGDLSNATNTNAQMKEYFERWLAQCKMGLGDGLPQQIWPSGETITPTSAFVNLHGSNATVSWITTTGVENGFMLFLKSGEASSTFTLKHNTSGVGRINTTDGQDLVLSILNEGVLLLKWGNVWTEMFRFPTANGSQLFTSSGTFTVPIGVRSIEIVAVGAGGGGGGGSASNVPVGTTTTGGAPGLDGGITTVSGTGFTTVQALGGYGGSGGALSRGGRGGKFGGDILLGSGQNGQNGIYLITTGGTAYRKSGLGGAGGVPAQSWSTYGRGGDGGDGGVSSPSFDNHSGAGGGGGGAGEVVVATRNVTSRQSLSITIGASPAGGAGEEYSGVTARKGVDGAAGGSGCVLIRW